MKDITLRERFDKFEDDREYHLYQGDKVAYLAFIEQEIANARKEMKEGIIKAIDDRIELMDKDFENNQPFISEAHGIIDLIQSLN